MMKLLALVPTPNEPGDNDNYFNTGIQRLNRSNFDAKVNWNRNANHQVWFKYSAMDALVHGDFSLGRRGRLSARAASVMAPRSSRSPASDRPMSSQRLVIDGTFGWTRFGQDVEPRTSAPTSAQVLGIPNRTARPARERHATDVHLGLSALGNPEGWNLSTATTSRTFNTNATWAKGAHDVRFGFDFVHHHEPLAAGLGEGRAARSISIRRDRAEPDALESTVGFQGGTPSFENDWNGLAAFLLGTPAASGKSSQFIKMDSKEEITPSTSGTAGAPRRSSPSTWACAGSSTRTGGGRRIGIESADPTTNEALIGGGAESPATTALDTARSCSRPALASPTR